MRILPAAFALLLTTTLACDQEPPLKLTLISAAEHKAYFPIDKGDFHELGLTADNGNNQIISCDLCHSGTDTFAAPVCIKCHQNDGAPLTQTHAGVAAFQLIDTVCYGCHLDGKRGSQIGVADHSRLFFPISSTDVHGGGNEQYLLRTATNRDQCAACHADPEDRRPNLCAECHATDTAPTLADGHLGVVASSFLGHEDSPSCKECHAETPINSVMHPLDNHNSIFRPDHHADGSPTGTADCIYCHDTHKLDPQGWAIDFGAAHCVGCHTHTSDCNLGNQGACN